MIGYLQIYYKIVGEKDIYYSAFDGDFGKPLTKYRLWSLKRSIKRLYSKFDKIHSIEYCDKKEYEKGMEEQRKIKLSWGEDGG